MIELLSLVGAPGLGKLTQVVGDWISDSRRQSLEEADRQFKRELAAGDKLTEYMQELHKSGDDSEHPSFISVTLGILYIMFGTTACVFILWCLYIQWEQGSEAWSSGLPIKDPEHKPNEYSILGGLLRWSWASKSLTFISPLGCAYLALHPLLYILGLVSSGRSPYKTR